MDRLTLIIKLKQKLSYVSKAMLKDKSRVILLTAPDFRIFYQVTEVNNIDTRKIENSKKFKTHNPSGSED